jgi:chromosome segregation ATPase
MSKNIVYNKENSGKLLGGGGPRDRQMIQRLMREREVVDRLVPSVSTEKVDRPTTERLQSRELQSLPLTEVKRKIDEAVAVTRKSEQDRFESGLKSLNDQLKTERKKSSAAQEQIINANAEIKKLKAQLSEGTKIPDEVVNDLKDKALEISKLQSELSNKEVLLKELQKKSTQADELFEKLGEKDILISELSKKLDKIYEKISDGSIQPLVGAKIDRPALEDKIFIDPLEDQSDMDAHISIEEDKTVESFNRDTTSDLDKLRALLSR